MARRKRGPSPRFRIGKVSVYRHHGAWWLYYRDGGRPVRRKVALDRPGAEQVAAQVNAQLTSGAPTLLAFSPLGVADLRQQFLDYHEHVLLSSVGTLRRYRSATQHLEDFARTLPKVPQAHEVRVEAFAAYLRTIRVAPNGHRSPPVALLRAPGLPSRASGGQQLHYSRRMEK